MDPGLFRKSNRPSGMGGVDLGLSKRANPYPMALGGMVQSGVRITVVGPMSTPRPTDRFTGLAQVLVVQIRNLGTTCCSQFDSNT